MIYVIGGTTASGKSSLAFKFAQEVNGVIINADAFAVYQELKIGTAKPTEEELKKTTNYMFNVRSVTEQFSIYDYQQEVRKIIDKYLALKRPIIMVGGSGLYIRAVLYDYQFTKQKKQINESKYIELSNLDLHAKLAELDDVSAKKIHPNNRKRVLRALAIAELGEETKSAQIKKQQKGPIYDYVLVILDAEKAVLNERIEARVREMFKLGLKEEVHSLIEHYPTDFQALQAIGYKEIIENRAMDDAFLINLIADKTIKYAKRQRTFFRHQFVGKFFYDKDEAFAYLINKHREK